MGLPAKIWDSQARQLVFQFSVALTGCIRMLHASSTAKMSVVSSGSNVCCTHGDLTCFSAANMRLPNFKT